MSAVASDMMARKSSYKVRFRHNVYPNLESEATRADIKKYDYFFGSEQIWVETPGKVDFVDEPTQGGDDGESPGVASSTGNRIMTAKRANRSRNIHTRYGPVSRRRPRNMNLPSHTIGNVSGDGMDEETLVDHDIYRPWQHIAANMYHYGISGPESVSSLGDIVPLPWQDDLPSQLLWQSTRIEHPAVWPLEDPLEMHLFRFWVDEAAGWWDSTSSDEIFRRVVPIMATQNSMLLNAILMYSAQHIQRFHANLPANPYFYHERLLQHLIPHLAEKGTIEDEGTLVAAMLLRAFEEFHAGTAGQTHLSTYELFRGPGGWLFNMSNPLVQACLMMHVRFELHHALLNRPSLRINYSENILEAPTSMSDDVCWENRIIWLTARILQWAERNTGSMNEWCELTALVDEWELNRPASFKAFSCDGRDPEYPRYYPELWISSPYHAAANVHLQICRMALAVHTPGGHYGGISTLTPVLRMRGDVLKGLKKIVASTRCDKFAVILSDDSDRRKMIEFLEEVDTMGWWPTEASIRWLWEQWRQGTGREKIRIVPLLET